MALHNTATDLSFQKDIWQLADEVFAEVCKQWHVEGSAGEEHASHQSFAHWCFVWNTRMSATASSFDGHTCYLWLLILYEDIHSLFKIKNEMVLKDFKDLVLCRKAAWDCAASQAAPRHTKASSYNVLW